MHILQNYVFLNFKIRKISFLSKSDNFRTYKFACPKETAWTVKLKKKIIFNNNGKKEIFWQVLDSPTHHKLEYTDEVTVVDSVFVGCIECVCRTNVKLPKQILFNIPHIRDIIRNNLDLPNSPQLDNKITQALSFEYRLGKHLIPLYTHRARCMV